jgi:hypothetical protein
MLRMLGFSSVALVMASPAVAEPPREPMVQFEIGVNTRRLAAASEADAAAFRTSSADPDMSMMDAITATTISLRFTGRTRLGLLVGMEAEAGQLSAPGTNVAGLYGVVGARADLGPLMFTAELAAGGRAIRYSILTEDQGSFVFEPRLRGQLWLSPRMTFGAAVGASLGDRDTWMAGLNLGIHSLDFDKH